VVTIGSAKRSFQAKRLAATMMARELVSRSSGGSAASSGPLWTPETISMSRTGSTRVIIMHRTSFMLARSASWSNDDHVAAHVDGGIVGGDETSLAGVTRVRLLGRDDGHREAASPVASPG
jgi:hypothetical protein